jgi:hypothetical protein
VKNIDFVISPELIDFLGAILSMAQIIVSDIVSLRDRCVAFLVHLGNAC